MNEKPLLSVVMISYQHRDYIQQAIESVFSQKTNFTIELIIANDHSPDDSDEIIKKTIQNAPENVEIKYTRHEKNLGMMPNFIWAIKQAKGKYIALCEGDDYWINENKLQQQVDFLEQNNDFGMCFHSCEIVSEVDKPINSDLLIVHENREYLSKEFLRSWIIPTASVVFRKYDDITDLCEKLATPHLTHGDIVLFLWIAERGRVYCFAEKMSTYRINNHGVTNVYDSETKYLKILKHLSALNKTFNYRYNDFLHGKIKFINLMMAKFYFKKGNLKFIKHLVAYTFSKH